MAHSRHGARRLSRQLLGGKADIPQLKPLINIASLIHAVSLTGMDSVIRVPYFRGYHYTPRFHGEDKRATDTAWRL